MPLPELIKKSAEKKIQAFCDKRVPPHARSQVRLTFEFRANAVTIFEERAPWSKDLKEWTSLPVAQIRYVANANHWQLFCADRNNGWHKYLSKESIADIDAILEEIGKDPTHIFWG